LFNVDCLQSWHVLHHSIVFWRFSPPPLRAMDLVGRDKSAMGEREGGRQGGRPSWLRETDCCRRLKEGLGPRAAGWSLRGPLIVHPSRKAVGQRAAAKWRLETKCCEWTWFLGMLCS
jgi:hypothetical protein